jgi:hypothetical protein
MRLLDLSPDQHPAAAVRKNLREVEAPTRWAFECGSQARLCGLGQSRARMHFYSLHHRSKAVRALRGKVFT